jgi:protein MpaA
VGCVHGTERAGIAATRALLSTVPAPGTAFWLVDAFNPDGCAAGTRQNARGVDLNRNQATDWRRLPRGTFLLSGRDRAPSPSRAAIRALVRRVRPDVSIWFHQRARLVDYSGGDPAIQRCYGRLVGLPVRDFGRFPGSITSWQNASFPSATAFVVELAPGPLAGSALRRHVAAVRAVGTRGRAACG